MSQLYLWQVAGIRPQNALQRFEDVLLQQCTLYQRAFGYTFTQRIHQLENILVGQIYFDLGLRGWMPWQQNEAGGVAWSGVCENFLDTAPAALLPCVQGVVHERPADLAEWDGRFGVCSWRTLQRDVVLATAATDSPTFWYSQGPDGWAVGNRALPLLKLVGRQPALDPVAASVFVSYGYLAGATALFKDVLRLPARQRVVLRSDTTPCIETYLSLETYLQHAPRTSSAGTLREGAERVATRVRHQLQHSAEPELLLTGGRDSRWIAAAIATTKQPIAARTSGPQQSKEVSVAQQVAAALQLPHTHDMHFGSNALIKGLNEHPERVALWTEVSEGVETIRHALPFQSFFHNDGLFPSVKHQVFHGLHSFGGLSTLNNKSQEFRNLDTLVDLRMSHAMVAPKLPPGLACGAAVEAAIEEHCLQIDAQLAPLRPSLGQWLNAFYWQNRCSQWGADMMSVKDLIDWHWTPLFDRSLICDFWNLDSQSRFSKRFIEEATLLLAPELKHIAYSDTSGASFLQTARRLAKALRRHSAAVVPGITSAAPPAHTEDLRVFWRQLLLDGNGHVWPDLIERSTVHKLIEQHPSDEVLWSLATVELFAKTHL